MKRIIRAVPPMVASILLLASCTETTNPLTGMEASAAQKSNMYVKVAESIKKGEVLQARQLQEHEGSAYNTPAEPVRAIACAVGRKAKHDLRLGQWLSENDFEPVSAPDASLAAYASRDIRRGEPLSRANVIFIFKDPKTMMPSGACMGTGTIGLVATRTIPRGKLIKFSDLLD